jgi:hypothetical protein
VTIFSAGVIIWCFFTILSQVTVQRVCVCVKSFTPTHR